MSHDSYRSLADAIDQEADELKIVQDLIRPDHGFWRNLVELLRFKPARIDRLWRIARRRPISAGETGYAPYLVKWAVANVVLWRLLLLLFVFETAIDLEISGLQELVETDDGRTWVWFDIGHDALASNLAMRTMSLTAALTAVAYYLNIFSAATAKDIPGPDAATLERSMRLVAVGPIGLQLVPLLIHPILWGPCAAAAGFEIAWNNRLARRFASTVQEEVSGERTRRVAMSGFFERYDKWGLNLGIYSAGVLAVWVLLVTGAAEDLYVYAAAIALAINMLRMYPQNCVKDAPAFRGSIARATHAARTHRSLKQTATEPGSDR